MREGRQGWVERAAALLRWALRGCRARLCGQIAAHGISDPELLCGEKLVFSLACVSNQLLF